MAEQKIVFTNDVAARLDRLIDEASAYRVFVLADSNTDKLVLTKLIDDCRALASAKKIVIAPGDANKNLAALQQVWTALQGGGATRRSLLVNLGGGVVTDLGGFAAATFKRGMRFINVPTTLLAAVDAAVGGKTGVNFNDFKNEIGVFKEADAVVISTKFFSTLPQEELKSGYAEMLKHGLLSGMDAYNRLLGFDFKEADGKALLDLLEESVEVKRRIVRQDPTEQGLRRALNLGHTAGHAFESLALHRNRPIPHGYAVAWGLVVEAVLSHMVMGFDSKLLYGLADYVYTHYGVFAISCGDYPQLLEYMRHDKKSMSGEYNFTLLKSPGDAVTGCCIEEDDVKAALDIYRDLMHI